MTDANPAPSPLSTSAPPVPDGTALGKVSIPGKWVVIGLLLLGVITTSIIFFYWDTRTRAHRPLIVDLGAAFPQSNPRVEGGVDREKHPVLRVVMLADFDPQKDEARYQVYREKILNVVRTKPDLKDFQYVDLTVLYMPHLKPHIERRDSIPVDSLMKNNTAVPVAR